jgi:hypothetical protein
MANRPISCRELGCRFNPFDYPNQVKLVCLDCGREEVLPKRGSRHDRFKEVRLMKRDIIQPYSPLWSRLQLHEQILQGEKIAKEEEAGLFSGVH